MEVDSRSTQPRWQRYSRVGAVIPCPSMRLDGQDWEDPIVTGSGEVRVTSATSFAYILRGIPDDVGHVIRSVRRQRDNPYDGRMRFRLNFTDDDGLEVAAGWTIPRIEPGGGTGFWTFAGEFDAISFFDAPADEVGTTNIYLLPERHEARIILRQFVSTENSDGNHVPRHELEVLDSRITFELDDAGDRLTVSANGSTALPQTLTENWLGEPLRIMFGQLIYPRFVARRNPDRTLVWVRPSPRWHPDSDWVALWNGPRARSDKNGFWRLYAALLTVIASARSPAGDPNFEANRLTRLYEELIQASRGSRWVWALTFASCAEGLVKKIELPGTLRPVASRSAIRSLSDHIDEWQGSSARLKEVAKNAVARAAHASTIQKLRALEKLKVITAADLAAWSQIRNRVMHGSLVSPFSTQEDDRLLLGLASLVHALTRHLIGFDPNPRARKRKAKTGKRNSQGDS